MHNTAPPLNALKAFEATARHLSFTLAAVELNVTPGALSHQIRGLEEFLAVKLFERQTRSIALTREGRLIYPGLQAGFGLIRDALSGLRSAIDDRVLVVSTPPGLTAKWLVARLYRFTDANPDLELRIASSVAYANFTTDGVDVAIRNLSSTVADDPLLVTEKLLDVDLVPVCSPGLVSALAMRKREDILKKIPLIHDDQLAGRPEVPGWPEWFKAAGVTGVDPTRGLRFSSADHAIDAAIEGAGLLLTHLILASDELRSGRLVMPFDGTLPSGRAYYFVCPKTSERQKKVEAFRGWLRSEFARRGTV